MDTRKKALLIATKKTTSPKHFIVRTIENEKCFESAEYNTYRSEVKKVIEEYVKDGCQVINYLEQQQTSYGLKYYLFADIDQQWGDYDKNVAQQHLANIGVVIVDGTCNQPIDNEYDLEEIYSQIKANGIPMGQI